MISAQVRPKSTSPWRLKKREDSDTIVPKCAKGCAYPGIAPGDGASCGNKDCAKLMHKTCFVGFSSKKHGPYWCSKECKEKIFGK